MGEFSTETLPDLGELRARWAKGVVALDNANALWRSMVNVDILETSCPEHSILGQVFGSDMRSWLDVAGTSYDDGPDAVAEAFVALGLAVMQIEYRPAPPMLAEVYRMLHGMPDDAEIPPIPVPRPQDVVLMEESALLHLWIMEIKGTS